MKYLFSILLTMFSFALTAQTPFSIQNSQEKDEFSVEQVSLANPWFGAKLSYNLDNDKPLDDNFLFSTKVMYTPVSGDRFAVPIVGGAGLGNSNILDPESGVNFGIYPYYLVYSTDKFKVIGHGGLGYKVVVDGVGVGEDAPQQIRLVGGLEAAFYAKEGSLPTTLSITPVYLYNTLEVMENTAMLEATVIMPIANGLGLLVDAQLPFNKLYDGAVRFGVIVNGQL